jgi:hypothetical protein
MAVDFGVGGWNDGLCDGCDEIQDVFVVGPGSGNGHCAWQFNDTDYCFYDGPPGPDENFELTITISTSGIPTAVFWQVQLSIDGDQGNSSSATWQSNTWNSEIEDDCFSLADNQGRIALTKQSDSHTGSACSGTMPNTTHVFDPLA